MAQDTIGIATLGSGGISGAHLKALQSLTEGRLVATSDVDIERARARSEEFGGERFFGSFEEAVACPGVDAVVVCLPHTLHRDAVAAAARAGKHILVEKPMATTLEDARAMVQAAEESGVVLMVGQVLRFREMNRQARSLIREGKIGQPRHLMRRRMGWFRQWVPWSHDPKLCGGIALYGFGSHEMDMLLWLTDSRAVRVYAEGEKVNPIWQDYDEVSMEMRLSNGCMASLTHSLNSKAGVADCVIIGDEGTLLIDSAGIHLNGEAVPAHDSGPDGMRVQLGEFFAAVREGREPEASGKQVIETTMTALEAARLSLESHTVIETASL
ncbi:MAG: Gfo/Idh/MocA family oxidoreductase [Armatimonadetes bacterium]|nr:Gfo/Idh/MocA family oxidoreductase [Armatimonadota bacterium]